VVNQFQEDYQVRYGTPWDPNCDEDFDSETNPTEEDSNFMKEGDYRGLVGKLQYLTHTRSEIAYCASKLARKVQKLRRVHWKAGQRTLAYLRETLDWKFRLEKGKGAGPGNSEE
jgi:hypothetical protein